MTGNLRWRDRLAAAGGQATQSLIRSADWTRTAGRRLLAAASSRVRGLEPWGIVFTLIGVVFTLIGVAIALITIMVELEDRQSERIFRAWQLVLTLPSAGSSRRETVEYLNREFDGFVCGSWVKSVSILLTGNSRRRCFFPQKTQESLEEIELIGTNLSTANLSDAYLLGSNLSSSNLDYADLSGAMLFASDLTNAGLTGADLTNTFMPSGFLTGADLTGAFMTGVNLRDANLRDADLTGADLRDADLTQQQLDSACGLSPPDIPTGLIWRSGPCRELQGVLDIDIYLPRGFGRD